MIREKNPAALKGKKRMQAMTPEQRAELARKAAAARWRKDGGCKAAGGQATSYEQGAAAAEADIKAGCFGGGEAVKVCVALLARHLHRLPDDRSKAAFSLGWFDRLYRLMESTTHAQRVREGLARARAAGKRFGRRPRPYDAELVARLVAQGLSGREIRRRTGVSWRVLRDLRS